MMIHEMTLEECRGVLAQANVARLTCDMEGQPYAVPVYLAYYGTYLLGFSTMGLKIDCMRANPLVSVEIDDIKSQNEWISVVVFGSYEELPDTPEYRATRAHAHELLQRRAMWWEPACVAIEDREYKKALSPIFYRIHIDRMTGRRASISPVQDHPAARAKDQSWFSKVLDRVLPR